MKFGSDILGVEPPVDGGSSGVALRDQSIDFPPEGLFAGEPPLQAAAGQDAELDFGHSLPGTGYGVVHDHPDHWSLWVGFIRQPAHPAGEV